MTDVFICRFNCLSLFYKITFMELMDVQKDTKLIYQHNIITSGKYDYSSCMLDILFMVLSCLEKDRMEYTIHNHDIEEITGRKWNYAQLREATENIGSRMFEIETPERHRQMWLFEYVDYMKGTGSFNIKINESAKPYFFELKNNFTSMQLKSVLNCSSKYAKRLYAIACQWRSVGTKRFEIKELKEMLGLIDKKGNEQFERISDFKIKVLDIARKQISENTDIELDYELKKKGREFFWVTLSIDSQKFKQLEIEFDKTVDIQKFKSKVISYGLTPEQAELIATKEKETDFDNLINDLNEKIKSRKITVLKSPAYLVGIYQNKGILPKKD